MKQCVFCQIIGSVEPAAIIYRDDQVLVFLDNRPLFAGHCLLVPLQHITTLSDLPCALLLPFFEKLQQLAKVVELGMQAEGTFIAMNNKVSQSVPHLHAHVVPRKKGDGLKGFFWPRHPYKESEMEATQMKLIATWQALADIT